MTTKAKPPVSVELVHTGNSLNIAFYTDTIIDDIFVEVLRGLEWSFYVKVNRWNAGGKGYKEVGKFDYTPKTKPAPGNLPTADVNRIVNAWLKEQIGFELGAKLLGRTGNHTSATGWASR